MAVHNCKYCKAECGFGGENRQRDCKGYIPMTNADRIRAMSDEELARILIFWNDDWGRWETDAGCIEANDPRKSIEKAIKAEVEWLKQPAEVE